MDSIIRTTSLSFSYNKKQRVLSEIELHVERGNVYGFLGPNGSGKTTTLRLLLGLLPLQAGKIELFGKSITAQRVDILRKTGSLVETPSLYSHLTARENMDVYRRIYGVPKERIGEVLRMVGLEETGNKLVKRFSLGMKQRLSIALALLPGPELLILDEPANGLDPEGIIELRKLLRKLNKVLGMTIVISSHLLAEIEKTVSHVGIISQGRLLFQGTMDELKRLQHKHSLLHVRTSDDGRAAELLKEWGPQQNWDELLVPYQSVEDIAAINRLLYENRVDVFLLKPREIQLEQLFIDLTKNKS